MKRVLLWLWQLPQNLLGLGMLITMKITRRYIGYHPYKDTTVYRTNTPGFGVSLGNYIFLDKGYDATSEAHEWGHARQSLIFGPLYLLIVGIPSAIANNLWDRLFHRKWGWERRVKWYYSRWPEADADRRGGVKRF